MRLTQRSPHHHTARPATHCTQLPLPPRCSHRPRVPGAGPHPTQPSTTHRQRSAACMATFSELQSTPGVCAHKDAATKDFIFQQTMLRIKDPTKSLDFYTRVLGMTLVAKLDFPSMAFTLYFLAFVPDPSVIPDDPAERARWMFGQPAVLELTHNWGTEADPDFKGYANGNADPGRGFGHIGLAVPDVYAAAKRFEELGVAFVKRPDDGKMKGLAFIQDPDGYWVEILNPTASGSFANFKEEGAQ